MIEVKTTQEFQQVLQQNDKVLVDFFANWCGGPCKQAIPKFTSLASQYPSVAFVKVDIDLLQEVSSEYQISAVPSFIYFQGGKEVEKVIGLNKLQALVSKHL